MANKFTIIMPVYNTEKLVIRALDSIPVRDDLEVICIDDCSTDSSYEVLKNYSRIPIRVFQTPINSGPGIARNIGYDNATGDFIFGLDSDDYLLTDNFNKFLDSWSYDDFDIVHTCIMTNRGTIWGLRCECVAVHTYWLRREFMGDTRMPGTRRGEDQTFIDLLKAKKPKEGLVKAVLLHYDWGVREESITYQYRHGKVDKDGEKIKHNSSNL